MSLANLAKCLDELVNEKAISRDQAEDIQAQARRTARKNADLMAMPEAERLAVEQTLKTRRAEASRAKYLLALEAMKAKEIIDAAELHSGGKKAGFLAFLSKDWMGKARNTNVEYRMGAFSSLFDRSALTLFETYKPKKLGFQEQTPGLNAVVRALFGEETGDPTAQAAAKAWGKTADQARLMFNRAGGDIGHLDAWRLPQTHDEIRIRRAGFEEWSKFIDKTGVEIFDDAGDALKGPERLTVLKDVYDTLASGGLNKMAPGASQGFGKKIANRRAESRVLHFTHADGWLAYHERFGTGSLYSVFAGHLRGMARDIAAMEVLGPNPARMVGMMADLAERESKGGGRAIRRTWQELAGNTETVHGWRRYLYAGFQNTRNLLRSAQMGSALLSSLGDFGTVKATAAWNGLQATGVIKNYLALLNPASAADRDFARSTGLIAEATQAAIRNSQVVDEDLGKGFTAKLANAIFELSGLNAHTNGLRAAFGLEVMRALAQRVAKGWRDLEAPFRAMLERGGLDEALWDAARKAPLLEHEGTAFMDVLELAANESPLVREAGLRLHQALMQETDMAVPVPDARARGMMNLGTAGNTLIGEIVRTAGMYRSFPVTVTLTHGFRTAQANGLSGKLGYGLPLFVSLTGLGMLSLQSKQIALGKDPRDMTNWLTWGQAMMQGGGLGILGDFFGAALSRTDKDLAGTLAGTGYGLVSDVINLTTRNAMAEAEGKRSNSTDDLLLFLQRYQPGSNLWYAKLAVDRLAWAQLRLAADPQAARAMDRLETKAQKDYGQGFWWRPAEPLPDRLPSFTASLGDKK